jgi:alpha-ribazole phosphatase
MIQALWMRHGATDWNLNGRYLGGTDLPLNDEGHAEVRRVIKAYRKLPVDRVYTSPLVRARATAEVYAQAWSCEVVVDERLRELHFGAWEGKTTAEIQAEYPKLWGQWLDLSMKGPFPGGGESFAVMHRRVGDFLRDVALPPTERIAVVAHGGVLRASMVHLLNLQLEYYWRMQFDRASVSCTSHDGQRVVLDYLNRSYANAALGGMDPHA